MAGLVPGQSNSANHAETRAEGGPGDSWYDERCHEARTHCRAPAVTAAACGRACGRCCAQGAAEMVPFVPVGITTTSVAQWNRHPVRMVAWSRPRGRWRRRIATTAAAFGSVSALLAAEAWRRALMNESPAR